MSRMIKGMSFVVGVVLVLVLGFSYGTFIYTSDNYRATEMLVSSLTYGIDITSSDATVSGKTVNVSYGTTAVVYLKVTSLNKVDTKYGVDYKIIKGTGTVKYASNTGWLPTGKINENNVGTYEKVIKVVISATTDITVDFTVTGGFTNNELTEVATGYTRITEKADNIISYNDTLVNVVKKETINNIYGGESTNNYAQYPINDDNTKNIWRILGTYTGIGTKIISNQTSTTTKDTLSTDLTNFYNTLEKQDTYILNTDKFNCANTSCTSSSYSKVGLISTSEYEMLGGINSYLASSESYFALDNGTIKNITSGGIEETSTSSGLRPAVYLQDYVTVTGSGTVSDPFKLKLPEYAVVLNVVNGIATLPSKMITRGENATYEITPNTGYKLVLSSNTCNNGTLEGNVFTITNVTSAQTCTITLTPESYTLTLDPNGGSVSTTSKTVTYDSTYGDLPTPTRTGYTFNGWYTASSGGTKVESTTQVKTASNHTLYAHWAPVTYTITLNNQSATSAGTATAYYQYNTTKTVNGTLCYYYTTSALTTCLTNGYTITKPTKTGYTFGGYYTGTNGSGTQYVDANGTFINNIYQTTGNKTLYAKWTLNKYTLTLTKGTGVSTIYYKINGATSYSSATSTQNLSVNYNSTYYYYGVASTGYTISTCTASSPCSGTMGTSAISKTLNATINKYTLTLTKGTGISTIYYKINGASSYSSATSTQNLSVNYGSTYYYYGVASTGYTISSCTASSPCSGTMGTSTVSKTLSATINTYKVTLNVVNGTGSTSKTVNYNTTATFTGISPNSGYSSSNPTVSCTGGTLSGTTLTVKNVTSTRTCTITFNKMTLSDKLLADKTTRPGARTDFSTVLTTDNTKTLYTSTEDGTTVYYFAGNATDNWVKFGGYYWRIIRTNKDGGIRLLYHSTSTTATDAYIKYNSVYNSMTTAPLYVGYMYGTTGSLANNRLNTNSSVIKTVIDEWYLNNLYTNYGKYISTTAVYCNDRGTTYSTNTLNFPAYTRLVTNKTPTYNCANSKDAFSGSNNDALLKCAGDSTKTCPMALMIADEIVFAGGMYNYLDSANWYYYNSSNGSSVGNSNWWTMTPHRFNNTYSYIFIVYGRKDYPGRLNELTVNKDYSGSDYGLRVRPVTSLKSCVKWKSGDGSASSPYEIEETTSGC